MAWAEPADYSLLLRSSCGERTGTGLFHVVVANFVVASFEGIDEAGVRAAELMAADDLPTLGGLVGMAEAARAAGADAVTLETDAVASQPVSLLIDPDLQTVDDEVCYDVESVEARASCGFGDAPLAYATRATTAALDVQEAVGDPLSDDPADIYVTRDKFEQGAHFGRLVCMVLVDQRSFTEVTVHPDDGGRFTPPDPTPVITPTPLAPGFIEIVTHCGLDFPRIEFEGETWKFDIDEPDPNAPDGWGFNTTVVEIRAGPNGPVIIGPDGSEWQLILAEPDDGPSYCM